MVIQMVGLAVLGGAAIFLLRRTGAIIERWRNFPPTVKKAAKSLVWAMVISTALTVLTYYVAAWHFAVPTLSLQPNRVFAFLDSVLAGIAAFALLGAFTFLASVRRPEEEAIEDRISFLYSARQNYGAAYNNYLKEQVMLLGANVTSAKFRYHFTELSSDRRSLKTIVTVQMTIVNMMKHHGYTQQMPLRISVPSPSPDMQLVGIVHYVRTSSKLNDGFDPPVDRLKEPRKLTKEDNEYRDTISLEIEPGGELLYEYMFDAWEPVERADFHGANRFVERANLEFLNHTSNVITVSPNRDTGARKCVTIECDLVLQPGERSECAIESLAPEKDIATMLKVTI